MNITATCLPTDFTSVSIGGLGGNVGVEYRHVQVSFGLHRSLMNPLNQTLVMMPKPKDRSWMLTVTYII